MQKPVQLPQSSSVTAQPQSAKLPRRPIILRRVPQPVPNVRNVQQPDRNINKVPVRNVHSNSPSCTNVAQAIPHSLPNVQSIPVPTVRNVPSPNITIFQSIPQSNLYLVQTVPNIHQNVQSFPVSNARNLQMRPSANAIMTNIQFGSPPNVTVSQQLNIPQSNSSYHSNFPPPTSHNMPLLRGTSHQRHTSKSVSILNTRNPPPVIYVNPNNIPGYTLRRTSSGDIEMMPENTTPIPPPPTYVTLLTSDYTPINMLQKLLMENETKRLASNQSSRNVNGTIASHEIVNVASSVTPVTTSSIEPSPVEATSSKVDNSLQRIKSSNKRPFQSTANRTYIDYLPKLLANVACSPTPQQSAESIVNPQNVQEYSLDENVETEIENSEMQEELAIHEVSSENGEVNVQRSTFATEIVSESSVIAQNETVETKNVEENPTNIQNMTTTVENVSETLLGQNQIVEFENVEETVVNVPNVNNSDENFAETSESVQNISISKENNKKIAKNISSAIVPNLNVQENFTITQDQSVDAMNVEEGFTIIQDQSVAAMNIEEGFTIIQDQSVAAMKVQESSSNFEDATMTSEEVQESSPNLLNPPTTSDVDIDKISPENVQITSPNVPAVSQDVSPIVAKTQSALNIPGVSVTARKVQIPVSSPKETSRNIQQAVSASQGMPGIPTLLGNGATKITVRQMGPSPIEKLPSKVVLNMLHKVVPANTTSSREQAVEHCGKFEVSFLCSLFVILL
jgi:hypothetical protein